MGFDIIIGELKGNSVRRVFHKKAPAFGKGDMSDHINSRHPSYSVWGEFLSFVGLTDVFYNKKTGLMREHPGLHKIKSHHQKAINKAYDEFYKKYPNAQAGFSPKINTKKGIYDDPDWPKENGFGARLEWLKYWVDWACTKNNPYIENH